MFAANWIMFVEDRFNLVRQIRNEVFIDEMGYTQEQAYDARDYYAFHLLITDDETGEPMATARIRAEHDYDFTYIGDIAVRSKYRATNYAEFALRMLLHKAQKLSAPKIIACIRNDEVEMYKKFGFTIDNDENGHVNVSVPTDKVLWPSECKEHD